MNAPTRISQRTTMVLQQVDGGRGLVRKLRAGEAKRWPYLAANCRAWWGEPEYAVIYETAGDHKRIMATRAAIKGFLQAGGRITGRIF